MTFAQGISVTIERGGGRDQYGDPTPSVEHVVADCAVEPRVSTELDNRATTVIVGLTLMCPFGSDIVPTDRIRIDVAPWKGRYDVQGEPGHYRHPWTGWEAGTVVALTRRSG